MRFIQSCLVMLLSVDYILRSRDDLASDNKSPGFCCRISRPTVTDPSSNQHYIIKVLQAHRYEDKSKYFPWQEIDNNDLVILPCNITQYPMNVIDFPWSWNLILAQHSDIRYSFSYLFTRDTYMTATLPIWREIGWCIRQVRDILCVIMVATVVLIVSACIRLGYSIIVYIGICTWLYSVFFFDSQKAKEVQVNYTRGRI